MALPRGSRLNSLTSKPQHILPHPPPHKRKSTNPPSRVFVQFPFGGRDGIRTHVPLEGDNRISSAGRYNHFDTLPYFIFNRSLFLTNRMPALCGPLCSLRCAAFALRARLNHFVRLRCLCATFVRPLDEILFRISSRSAQSLRVEPFYVTTLSRKCQIFSQATPTAVSQQAP